MSLPVSRSDGSVSDRPSPAMPSSTARPPGRQSSVASATADGDAGRLDDEVELRGVRRLAGAGHDDLGGAEPRASSSSSSRTP